MPDLDDRFRCVVFNCELSVRACLLRHTKTWASGGRRGARAIPRCGTCPVGAALLASMPAFVAPPPNDAPEVLPPAQRLARARYLRENLDAHRGGELAPLEEVALCSRDDPGREAGLPDL